MAEGREKVQKKPKEKAGQEIESLHQMVAKKAFEIYEKRGKEPGRDLDDWLEAERIIKRTRKR